MNVHSVAGGSPPARRRGIFLNPSVRAVVKETPMPDNVRKGGRFIFEPTLPESVFTMEDFGEEDLMFAKTAYEFAVNEVLPRKAEVEGDATKVAVHAELLKKAGELGLLMVEVPEEYGGLGQGLRSAMLVAESSAKNGSFTTSMMCHTGIGSLPIVYFGTPAQKAKYLPKLATGEWLGAYALTEAGAGSDALNAKTKAVKSPDGKHWILNGVKQFITNAGFADLYTVYAKVDGEHFTAFIVEAKTPGVSTGPEEHKMGIKGSSTRQLMLDDAKIPIENVLGEIGKGHKVALNILNIGRLKLGLGSLGTAKEVLKQSLQYAGERKQFNQTIDRFQIIQKKLADMACEIYAVESMAYRAAGDIDAAIATIDIPKTESAYFTEKVACIEEFAIEDSILKVYGSESLARVVDEGVQLHGGYGFVEDYYVCGAYRDARINRIFEGTNEVNRMLIPGTLMRRAMKGELDLMTPIMNLMAEIKADGVAKEPQPGVIGREATAVDVLRKWVLLGLGVTAQKAMSDPKYMLRNQILLEHLANAAMDLYAAESSYLRTAKAVAKQGETACRAPIMLTRVVVYEKLRDAMERVRQICADVAGDNEEEFAKNQKAMQRLQVGYGLDTMSLKSAIARHLIERGRYNLA